MKYIKTYESINELTDRFVGNYTITKGLPGIEVSYTKNTFFMIYVIPGTFSGPINKEYTFLIVTVNNNKKLEIFIKKEKIEKLIPKKQYMLTDVDSSLDVDTSDKEEGIPAGLVGDSTLEDLNEIALYTSKSYDDCMETLTYIDSMTKYNI